MFCIILVAHPNLGDGYVAVTDLSIRPETAENWPDFSHGTSADRRDRRALCPRRRGAGAGPDAGRGQSRRPAADRAGHRS